MDGYQSVAHQGQATRQKVSGGQQVELCMNYHLSSISCVCPVPLHPRPWKNCLPRNWSLVPRRLGTTDLYGHCEFSTVAPEENTELGGRGPLVTFSSALFICTYLERRHIVDVVDLIASNSWPTAALGHARKAS